MIDNNEIPKKGLCSDSSYSISTKILEWRVVDIATNNVLYSNGLRSETLYLSNLGEFFGICRAIKWVLDNNSELPIYYDSLVAYGWIKSGKVNTGVDNSKLLKLVKAGEEYIQYVKDYIGLPELIKWNTFEWSDIPADYQRKDKKNKL